MANSRGKLTAALILFTLQLTTSAKNNARPVYEVISEKARMDDIRLSNAPSTLPYGNPLAGNSAQNARLHASNQQAMFNAERIRQHKAQLQRLTQGPPIIDSYMKAYHESQESHQMALEQQQAGIKEIVSTSPIPNMRNQLRNRTPQNRQRTTQSNRERNGIKNQRQEFKSRMPNLGQEKITRANAVNKERSRNHRSYGSVEYDQYLQSKFPLNYLAATAPDQGVTIKPNGNIGVTKEQEKESSNLHTTVVPSIGKYLPKSYLTVKEINALESILRKSPKDQLTEFKTFINSEKDSEQAVNYQLKDISPQNLPDYYNSAIVQNPITHTNAYSVKDHTPITEEVDDVNPVHYQNTFVTPQFSTETPLEESAVSTGLKPSTINEDLYLNQDQSYRIDDDENESYHNYVNGVQHLAEDGTGVSAYGDENLHYAANYEFGYRVRDPDNGNYYGQYEAKAGERTNGEYHVLLPDGRMQKVQYSAGPSGYHADISYDHLVS